MVCWQCCRSYRHSVKHDKLVRNVLIRKYSDPTHLDIKSFFLVTARIWRKWKQEGKDINHLENAVLFLTHNARIQEHWKEFFSIPSSRAAAFLTNIILQGSGYIVWCIKERIAPQKSRGKAWTQIRPSCDHQTEWIKGFCGKTPLILPSILCDLCSVQGLWITITF